MRCTFPIPLRVRLFRLWSFFTRRSVFANATSRIARANVSATDSVPAASGRELQAPAKRFTRYPGFREI
jgi:hypothetical protein